MNWVHSVVIGALTFFGMQLFTACDNTPSQIGTFYGSPGLNVLTPTPITLGVRVQKACTSALLDTIPVMGASSMLSISVQVDWDGYVYLEHPRAVFTTWNNGIISAEVPTLYIKGKQLAATSTVIHWNEGNGNIDITCELPDFT